MPINSQRIFIVLTILKVPCGTLLGRVAVIAFLGILFIHEPCIAGIRVLDKVAEKKAYALVIGIDNYESGEKYSVPSLKYAEDDAKKVYALLTDDSIGIAEKSTSLMLLGRQATKETILRSVREIRNKLKDGDTVIIYWAGHSVDLPSSIGEGEHDSGLVAVDSRKSSSVGDISVVGELLPAAGRAGVNVVFIGDGCHIGGISLGRFERENWRVSILSSSKAFEVSFEFPGKGGALSSGFVKAITSPESDLDGDGYISLEEVYVAIYPQVVTRTFSNQHPSLSGSYAHHAIIAKAELKDNRLIFEEALPQDLLSSSSLTINDRLVSVDTKHSRKNELILLGGESAGIVGQGMTYLSNARNTYLFWRSGQTLKNFKNPYHRSFAIIVAIDDYARDHDALKRGPTGYDARGFMVRRATELKTALTRVGFQEKNIIELYDSRATANAIDLELKKFWKGGEHQDADRLFFYFGGHGDTFDNAGVLITYDFDKRRPTQTGFLMRDLTTRHSENILARHALFTLDACAAGLAVYKKLGGAAEVVDPGLDELSIIRNDTEPKARNFLVAGTGNQPAIWDQGGIFTQALIAGLSGKADLTGKRIIQFRSLANFVSNEVARRASQLNVKQQVEDYSLSEFGSGKVLFIFDEKMK